MTEEKVPFRRMVFICTNIETKNGRPACGLRGGVEICSLLKEEVKKKGLQGRVRALKSGCMDLCEKGPNVAVYPEGVLYTGVFNAEDRLSVAQSLDLLPPVSEK